MKPPRLIRTLVVDDSALARKMITDSLANRPGIEIVGTAVDPYVARDKILALKPDVITLDIEMPRMDGITFLKILMKHKPLPVIVMSSLTPEGSDRALEALEAGAVDVMHKPRGSFSASADGTVLAEKIVAAAMSRPRWIAENLVGNNGIGASRNAGISPGNPRDLILIGASTGGTEALKEVLMQLPATLPGICIVQHIPAHFSKAFANRLNQLSALEVKEARSGEEVTRGKVLIAPGGQHMVLRWTGSNHVVQLNEGPTVHHQRPAVDVMFDSAVRAGSGPHTLAILLTGMGIDGAAGMLALRKAGASTVAQNEATCVVFGMPKEAIRIGAARHVAPLHQIPQLMINHARSGMAAAAAA
ncbi:MAG: chemotaxis response regulator protein-glutamate methylesterase [Verrucomicrobiota bacterium]|nr:chemotaxis response regulator protein-glutamate methylesterase [Verrucomicrobiota bacterium]